MMTHVSVFSEACLLELDVVFFVLEIGVVALFVESVD
jgi:hypothetical protein